MQMCRDMRKIQWLMVGAGGSGWSDRRFSEWNKTKHSRAVKLFVTELETESLIIPQISINDDLIVAFACRSRYPSAAAKCLCDQSKHADFTSLQTS